MWSDLEQRCGAVQWSLDQQQMSERILKGLQILLHVGTEKLTRTSNLELKNAAQLHTELSAHTVRVTRIDNRPQNILKQGTLSFIFVTLNPHRSFSCPWALTCGDCSSWVCGCQTAPPLAGRRQCLRWKVKCPVYCIRLVVWEQFYIQRYRYERE